MGKKSSLPESFPNKQWEAFIFLLRIYEWLREMSHFILLQNWLLSKTFSNDWQYNSRSYQARLLLKNCWTFTCYKIFSLLPIWFLECFNYIEEKFVCFLTLGFNLPWKAFSPSLFFKDEWGQQSLEILPIKIPKHSTFQIYTTQLSKHFHLYYLTITSQQPNSKKGSLYSQWMKKLKPEHGFSDFWCKCVFWVLLVGFIHDPPTWQSC